MGGAAAAHALTVSFFGVRSAAVTRVLAPAFFLVENWAVSGKLSAATRPGNLSRSRRIMYESPRRHTSFALAPGTHIPTTCLSVMSAISPASRVCLSAMAWYAASSAATCIHPSLSITT